MVSDSGTTSGVGRPQDPFLRTGKRSTKTFACANGELAKATEVAVVEHNLREPAREMHITPGIKTASLASTGKYADANYATLYTKDAVEVYDMENTKIFVSKEAVLRGHRCKDGLYRIPLRAIDAKALSSPERLEDIPKETYNDHTVLVRVPTPKPKETIQSVYELRTQREMVRYYHAAAGFPVKTTWVAAIANNQYSSWPGLTVEAVERHFPESLETQKGHMRKQRAGIRSTKKQLLSDLLEGKPLPTFKSKQRDIIVQIFDTNDELSMKILPTKQEGSPKLQQMAINT